MGKKKIGLPGGPNEMITDPKGQWDHPGKNTRIEGNQITMQGVEYPVWAQPNVGPGMMMMPGEEHYFQNAEYVDEYPMMQAGGAVTLLKALLKSAGKNTKKIKNVANYYLDDFASEIDWSTVNKDILNNKSLLGEYNAIEKASKADGSWMKYSDGSTFDGTPAQFVQMRSDNFIDYAGGTTEQAEQVFKNKVYRGTGQDNADYTSPIGLYGNQSRETKAVFTTDNPEVALSYKNYNIGSRPKDSGVVQELGYPQTNIPVKLADAQGNNWRMINYDPNLGDEGFQRALDNNNVLDKFLDDDVLRGDIPDLSRLYLNADDYANYIMNNPNAESMAKIFNVKDGLKTARDVVGTNVLFNPNKVPLKSLKRNDGMFNINNPNIFKTAIPGAAAAFTKEQLEADGYLPTEQDGGQNLTTQLRNFQYDKKRNKPFAQYGIENKYSLPKRDGVRLNYDEEGNVNGESTHIMKAEIVDGRWYGFPTLFQNEDGTWNDTYEKQINANKKNWMPAFEEAKRRGEVIEFGDDKEAAIKFGEGSWKKMQEGGGVFEEGVEQYKWFKNYLQSPKYVERLKKEFPDYTNEQIGEEIKTRLENVMQTRVGFLPRSSDISTGVGGTQGVYNADEYPGAIMLRPEYSASTSDILFEPGNYLSGYDTIPLHEWSHAADDGGNRIPQSTTDFMLSRMKENSLGIPKDKYYYTLPTEYLGRMQPLRYLMEQEGLYDAGMEDFTIEDLEKARENKRIKNNVHFENLMDNVKSDEEFIELMNNVAAIDFEKQDDTMMAKKGGSVSWNWKGKSYSGTLIPSMETSKARYARTKNGKVKTLPKAQFGLSGKLDQFRKNLATNYPTGMGYIDFEETVNANKNKFGSGYLQAIKKSLTDIYKAGTNQVDYDFKYPKGLEQNAFNIYLQQEQVGDNDSNKFSISKYRPSKGDTPEDVYYSIPSEQRKKIYGDQMFPNILPGDPDYNYDALQEKYSGQEEKDMVVGTYTKGIGKNDDGSIYLSAYDKWDLNPLSQLRNTFNSDNSFFNYIADNVDDLSMGLGKPFSIYDRVNYIPMTEGNSSVKQYIKESKVPEWEEKGYVRAVSEYDFGGDIDKFINARYGTELPKAQSGIIKNLIKKGGPKIMKYIDNLLGKTDDVVEAAAPVVKQSAASKMKGLYEMLPIKQLEYPTHYGSVNIDDGTVQNALDILKAQGKYADDIGYKIEDLVGENIQYLGNQGGRTIVNVPLPNGKSQMFYKSTDLAGKGTEGLWQPYAGHARVLDFPSKSGPFVNENWFIKDGGFKNWYDSKSFRDIAGNLDKIAAEQGWDMSEQILKSKLKYGGDLPKAQRGLIKQLIKSGAKYVDDIVPSVKNYFKKTDEFTSKIDWGKWNKEIPNNKALMEEYTTIEKLGKANGTWMKNPDGSKFAGTPEQWVQVRSSNYKKAFPNAILDDSGSPLINYHGSGSKFDIFDESKFYSGEYGKGVYTSTDKEAILRSYANPNKKRTKKIADKSGTDKPTANLYELYINSNNPLTTDDIIDYKNFGKIIDNLPSLADWKASDIGKRLINENTFLKTDDDIISFIKMNFPGNPVKESFIDQGGDFLRAIDSPLQEGVTPFSNQMKSSIGNNGLFDMTDPNIFKQEGGEEREEFIPPFSKEDWEYYRSKFPRIPYPPPGITPTPEPELESEPEPVAPSTSGITPELLFSQAWVESNLDPSIKNKKGYMGLGQIGKGVIQDYKKANKVSELDPFNPQDNYNVQNWYMNRIYNSQWVDKPNQLDDVRLAKTLAGYSLGPAKAERYFTKFKNAGKDILNSFDWLDDLPDETSKYIKMIIRGENTEKRPRVQENIQDALTNDKYKSIKDLYFKRSGGESKIYKVYKDYINGNATDKNSEMVYDKLNRIHYKDAKQAGMGVPNYIMSYLVDNS